ncbi:hypothetical protein B0H14DRAFT_2304980, partial [Mycena olivaceomarginata]
RKVHVWSRLKHRNILPFIGVCNIASLPVVISSFYELGHVVYIGNHPDVNRGELVSDIL